MPYPLFNNENLRPQEIKGEPATAEQIEWTQAHLTPKLILRCHLPALGQGSVPPAGLQWVGHWGTGKEERKGL